MIHIPLSVGLIIFLWYWSYRRRENRIDRLLDAAEGGKESIKERQAKRHAAQAQRDEQARQEKDSEARIEAADIAHPPKGFDPETWENMDREHRRWLRHARRYY